MQTTHSPLCVCRNCDPSRYQSESSFEARIAALKARRTLSAPVAVTTGATNAPAVSLPSPLWDTKQIITGSAALDWVTITTYDAAAYAWVVREIEKCTDAKQRCEKKVMQYVGLAGDGYFFGDGLQAERPEFVVIKGKGKSVPNPLRKHYMVRLSNSLAHHVIGNIRASERGRIVLLQFKCTRVDPQYTHPEPIPDIDLDGTKRELRACEWPLHKGKKPVIDMIDKNDGLHTLYIGQRKESNRYQRIYMKQVGEQILLRWEVEYKQELAQLLWQKIVELGLDILAGVLAGEIAVVPLPEAFAPVIEGAASNPERLVIRREKSTTDKTMKWLYRQVRPALQRLMAAETPQIRDGVKEFLEIALLGEELPKYLGEDIDVGRWLPDETVTA